MSKVNLEGTGYMKFEHPRSEQDIKDDLMLLKEHLRHANHFIDTYKQDGRSVKSIEVVLNDLSFMFAIFENDLRHPSDIIRVFSDNEFFDIFSGMVRDIRTLKMLEYLEIADMPQHRKLIALAKKHLLQADIYLASHLEKK